MDNIKRKRCRRRKLSESDEGVATTVGTIMALLVFLSLLSLITQQYIPVWMEDKEAYHVDDVMGQFTQIKGTVDTLVINEHTDYSMYSTVTLGSEGVPLFASRSMGVIRLLPDEGGVGIEFNETDEEGNVLGTENFEGVGSLSLETRNRYFEEQTIVYENGAIILQQEEDSILRAPPQLTIQDGDIDIHIIDIQGEETRLGGSRNIGVATELWGTSRASYSNPEDVTIQIDTENTGGWERWLISETDLEAGDMDEENGTLSLDIDDINSLSVTYSTIHMKIST
ncbi:MAG: DUF7289 family protein [Candidatus Saliniplasma sp.]